MSNAFSLTVPAERRTVKTGEQFYQYHVENSTHDDSLEDVPEFEYFMKRLKQNGRFRISQKPTKQVIEAGTPPMSEILFEYEDEDGVVREEDGLEMFVQSLETARENLREELDEDRMDGVDRTIEMCINIIEFAKLNGYGVSV